MINRTRLAAAVAVYSLLFGINSLPPDLGAPLCSVAQAEGEITQAALELDLGKPLQLKVDNVVTGMPEYSAEQRTRRFTTMIIDGKVEQKWLPIGIALDGYNMDQSEETIESDTSVIKSLYVHRADSLVFSFTESQASYKGGMRGRFAIVGQNYDSATGAELKWEDVFGSKNIVLNEVASLLKRNYPDAPFASMDFSALTEKVKKAMEEGSASWSLDPCGATFYFNMFSLASDPYAPVYSATLTFSVNGFCFKDKYRHSPKEWCMEVEPRTQMRLTLDDSVLNTTEIRAGGEGLKIILGCPAAAANNGSLVKAETVFTDPTPMQGVRPVFAKMADGRQYFYIDCHLAPDPADYQKGYDAATMAQLENRHELRVYQIENKQIHRVEVANTFTMMNELTDDSVTLSQWFIMTDPNEFKLNICGVPPKEARRLCRVDEKGQPEIIDVFQ